MIEDQRSEKRARSRVFRLVGRLVCFGFLALILLAVFAEMLFTPLQIFAVLLSGWWFFLKRTIPAITWNWDLVGMGIVCAVLIFVGAQWFLNWTSQSIRKARALDDGSWRWPWKLTWCGLTAVVMLFLVGMSIGGIAHQVGWMISSPEPLFEPKRHPAAEDLFNMRQLGGGWEQANLETHGDVQQMRSLIWRNTGGFLRDGSAPALREAYHVLLIVKPDGEIGGAIIFPRDADRRRRVGFLYSYGDERASEPEQKLDEILARHKSSLLAL